MIEIRIHGRGGQGNVVAAYLMASAAFEAGQYCQAFPAFGAERRGAPVEAYIRIDSQPILRRDTVRSPSLVVVQDATLLHETDLASGLAAGGGVLVNSERAASALREDYGIDILEAIPASGMARERIGRPVPNVALLAGLLSLTGMMPVDALVKALSGRFSGEVLKGNEALAREAAGRVEAGAWREVAHASSA
ncbi:MAG: pyruvate oxidoreductase subunit gamma [Proteobacteria bacterium]|nr:MAG: pyruvate oxidoreductase subunit gamma [Pseudomonadota bacterium]